MIIILINKKRKKRNKMKQSPVLLKIKIKFKNKNRNNMILKIWQKVLIAISKTNKIWQKYSPKIRIQKKIIIFFKVLNMNKQLILHKETKLNKSL